MLAISKHCFPVEPAESGVLFVAADTPTANNLTVWILAVVAQEEAAKISRRTMEALQAVKARGNGLGDPNGAAALRCADKGCADRIAIRQAKADRRAPSSRSSSPTSSRQGIKRLPLSRRS